MRKITILFALFIIAFAHSQVRIGDGNDGDSLNSPPINAHYEYSYGQSIYLASEINASGNITSIEFTIESGANFLTADEMVDVWIGHTTKSSFNSTTDWVDVTTLTQVLTNGTISVTNRTLTITFDIPFAYNGVDNLIIAVDANEPDYGGDNEYVLSTNGPLSNMSLMYRSDFVNPDPTSAPAGFLRQNRGNITFNGITSACPPPSAVSIEITSVTEVTISWAAGGSEINWTYEYGVTGFTLGNGVTGMTNMPSVDLMGLTQGETYDVYVRANCGGGDSAWTSVETWIMPPVNDMPSNALPLTIGTSGSACGGADTITGITNASTSDSGVAVPSCGNYTTSSVVGDLWYTLQAPMDDFLVLNINNVSGISSVAGALYLGTPGALTEVSCTEIAGWPWVIVGLNPGETYYLRVWDYWNDDIGTFDLCAGTQSAIVPNYLETFDTYPPDHWTEASGPYGNPSGTTSAFIGFYFVNDFGSPNGMSASVYIHSIAIDEYTISPIFDLSGGTYYLNFDIGLTEWNTTNATTLGVDDYVALLVTEDDGANWTELTRWDATTPVSELGESADEIVLSGYGEQVKFAFYAFSDTSNQKSEFFIDNFQITETTLSSSQPSIEGFNLYPTIVEQNLNFTARENVRKISIYNLLGQEVFSAFPNSSNSSIDLSLLKDGVYIVKVEVGGKTGTYKIIKS